MIDISETIKYQSDYIPIVKEIVVEPPKEDKLSCIQYARQFIEIPYNTNAKDLVPNSVPIKGGAVLFSYTTDDHIAIITKIGKKGFWVKEANFEKESKIGDRYVSFANKFIRGFCFKYCDRFVRK